MDILIFGAGAIGSLLAYRLGAAGHRITAVGRAPFVRAVGQRGLLVEHHGRAVRATRIRAVERIELCGDTRFDLVLITTKAFDTATAANQVWPFVQRGAPAVVIQDGVGGMEVASKILGPHNLYAGVVTMPVEVLKPAVISPQPGNGGLAFAPVGPGRDLRPLVKLFAQARFPVQACTDWQAMQWSRLMLGLVGNAVPAILNRNAGQAYADRALVALERGALREARSVVRRMRLKLIPLPGYPVPLLTWLLCALPSPSTHLLLSWLSEPGRAGKRPSLLLDLQRGRPQSEVEYLNGAVYRAGHQLGVPTPINQVVYETLTGLARNQLDWLAYEGQAERLVHRVTTKRLASRAHGWKSLRARS